MVTEWVYPVAQLMPWKHVCCPPQKFRESTRTACAPETVNVCNPASPEVFFSDRAPTEVPLTRGSGARLKNLKVPSMGGAAAPPKSNVLSQDGFRGGKRKFRAPD